MSRRGRLIVAVSLCVVVVGGILALTMLKRNGKTAAQPSYATAVARRSSLSVTVTGTGSVTLSDRREIRAEVSGIVREILVEPGQNVKSGDIIMKLENADVLAQAKQARISYELALNKLASMVGTTPDKAMSVDVSNGIAVTSKWSGRLTTLKVSQGDNVGAGSIIGMVSQDSKVLLVTALTEGYASRLRVGDPVSVRIEGFDGEVEGRVATVSQSSRASGTSVWFDVVVEIPNPGLIRAGTKAHATFRSADGYTFLGDGVIEMPASGAIKAPVSGTISKILLREGSDVKAGDAVLIISDPSLATDIQSQRLNVEQARLELEKRQRNVDSLTVRSPADGVVVSIPVELGNNITEQPVLAIIADTSRAKAVIQVDELDVGKIKVDMPARITADALQGKTFTGRVRAIAAEGVQQSGVAKFEVTVDIDSPEGLRTGMTASVEILVAEKPEALVVPAEAVTGSRGQETVRVVDSNGQITVRRVKVGLASSRLIEVLEGLNEGDRVVIAGGQNSSPQIRMPMFMGPGAPGGGPNPSQRSTSRNSGGGNR